MEKKLFDKLMKGAREAAAHAQGKPVKGVIEYRVLVPKMIDVKTIRKRIGMTQKRFAETFGFDINSIASWESGRRNPDKSARILLGMIDKNPALVLEIAGR